MLGLWVISCIIPYYAPVVTNVYLIAVWQDKLECFARLP